MKKPHSMKLQEAAQRLQIPENTLEVPESGKHQPARICSTLLPRRFPGFARPMFFLLPERSEGAENMTPQPGEREQHETDKS